MLRWSLIFFVIAIIAAMGCTNDILAKLQKRKARHAIECAEYDKWSVSGKWRINRRTGTYRWVKDYQTPKKGNAYWIEGRWASSSKGRRYIPGHWQ